MDDLKTLAREWLAEQHYDITYESADGLVLIGWLQEEFWCGNGRQGFDMGSRETAAIVVTKAHLESGYVHRRLRTLAQWRERRPGRWVAAVPEPELRFTAFGLWRVPGGDERSLVNQIVTGHRTLMNPNWGNSTREVDEIGAFLSQVQFKWQRARDREERRRQKRREPPPPPKPILPTPWDP